ncbi:MAG: VOC family protein [Blastocatellia bacterium]|nr:VOC family protein [Blastocatellia bacterium]
MKFSHLGVAVQNIERAVSVYRDLFGYRVLSGPFDDSTQKATVCFIGTGGEGDLVIELVAPLEDDSPVNRMLAKGASAYHICYEVDDIDRTLADSREKGCVIVSKPVPAVAFEGRRIAWFYTPTRQLVEVVER